MAALYARSLHLALAHGVRPDVPAHLKGFAKLALAAGDSLRSARLWGAAETLRADYERAVAAGRNAGNPDGFTLAWAEGRAWTWEQAADYALEA